MGLIDFAADIVQAGAGQGDLAMAPVTRERFNSLKPTIKRVARETGISAPMLAAIMWNESAFQSSIVNEIDCKGLMQICPVNQDRTIYHQGEPFRVDQGRWRQPYTNMVFGARLLIDQHEYFEKPLRHSLGEYSGHITKNPQPYVDRVVKRATFLAPQLVF